MTILYAAGDAVEGKKLGCEFRDWSGVRVFPRTGAHRGMRASLDDAYCVIERPHEWIKAKQKTPSPS